jgi:hypothetical protein
MENWQDIPGYEGIYQISDLGRVKSLSRVDCNGRPIRERIRKAKPRPYPAVTLLKDGVSETRRVHRMVLEAFVGPRPDGTECRHLNGEKLDNRLVNLAWGTPEENTADTVKHGARVVGERTYNAKLREDDVREIRRSRLPLKELTAIYGISQAQASRVRNGSRWAHVQ